MIRPQRSQKFIEAFKHAIDGVSHAYHTQRHLRFHFRILVVVLLLALALGFDRRDFLLLCFAIALVLITEMFNTAIEAAVDLHIETFHPLAKFAKDIAAGAVLVATINSVVVGILLFTDLHRWPRIEVPSLSSTASQDWLIWILVNLTLLSTLLLIGKARGQRGTLLKGGVVSGHSALAFFIVSTIYFITRDFTITFLTFLLATLVGQSRVEAGIHSLREVIMGALLGIGVPLLTYLLLLIFVH